MYDLLFYTFSTLINFFTVSKHQPEYQYCDNMAQIHIFFFSRSFVRSSHFRTFKSNSLGSHSVAMAQYHQYVHIHGLTQLLTTYTCTAISNAYMAHTHTHTHTHARTSVWHSNSKFSSSLFLPLHILHNDTHSTVFSLVRSVTRSLLLVLIHFILSPMQKYINSLYSHM